MGPSGSGEVGSSDSMRPGWAQPFRADAAVIRCAIFVDAFVRVQRPSQPPKAMRKAATIPAAVSAKQPRRTAISAANLAPEWT
jgi:hypothetical protein